MAKCLELKYVPSKRQPGLSSSYSIIALPRYIELYANALCNAALKHFRLLQMLDCADQYQGQLLEQVK